MKTPGLSQTLLALATAFTLGPLSLCLCSCSWLVLDELADAPAPCTEAGDCFAGSVCEDGACVTVDPPDDPPDLPPPATIGPDGGDLLGPDGVVLEVPAGALLAEVPLTLASASPSLLPGSFSAASAYIELAPDVAFGGDLATLVVPVDPIDCPAGCRIYRRQDSGAWSLRPAPADDPDDPRRIRGVVAAQGVYVAGAPLPDAGPTPVDAGPQDDDAGEPGGDGGDESDAGPPPTPSFSPCDFTPTTCPASELCWRNPFTGDGVCLRASAGAADTACSCEGLLPGASAPLCLPTSLCGAGALGATCAGGTADCSPAETSACVDVGAGAVCTQTCAGAGECGSGCCVLSPTDGGPPLGYCAAAGACATVPQGDACLDPAACASDTCASPDGLLPDACTEACTPGSCGGGLCCYPTDCAGGGLCVDDTVCAAVDTLLCGDLCLSDAACGAGTCVNGSCQ